MTSKKSYLPEIQREFTKRKIWLIALSSLSMVLYYVVALGIVLSSDKRNYSKYVTEMRVPLKEYLARDIYDLMGISYGGNLMMVLTIALAVITACTGFFFLYRTNSVDFYFSQPYKRKSLFMHIFFNGFLIYAVTLFSGILLGFCCAGAMGGMSAWIVPYALLEYLRLLILFFGVYAIASLAIFLSRNYFTAVIMMFVLLFSEILLSALADNLKSAYFATYYYARYVFEAGKWGRIYLTAPIYNHYLSTETLNALDPSYVYNGRQSVQEAVKAIPLMDGLKYDLFNVFLGGVFFFLALIAFEKRKAEDIGSGVVSRYIVFAVKLVISTALGIVAYAVMDSLFGTTRLTSSPFAVIMLILAVALTCIVGQIICEGNMKGAFKKLWHIIPAVLLAVFVVFIYKYDLTGYELKVPDEAKVEDCAIYFFGSNTDYKDVEYNSNSATILNNMHLTDKEDIISLAKAGQSAIVHNMDIYAKMETDRDSGYKSELISGYDAAICYTMKNGKKTARRITVPADTDADTMDRITGSEEYKRIKYNLDENAEYISKNSLHGAISYNTGYGMESVNASPYLFSEFADAYKKDLKKYCYSYTKEHSIIGEAGFFGEDEDIGYYALMYEVYDGFENTIAFLKEHGIYLEPEVPVEKVASITVNAPVYENGDEEMIYDGTAVYTDPDKIAEILKNAVYDSSFTEVWNAVDLEQKAVWISISLKDGYGDPSSIFYRYSNRYDVRNGDYMAYRDDVPEYVLEDIKGTKEY